MTKFERVPRAVTARVEQAALAAGQAVMQQGRVVYDDLVESASVASNYRDPVHEHMAYAFDRRGLTEHNL